MASRRLGIRALEKRIVFDAAAAATAAAATAADDHAAAASLLQTLLHANATDAAPSDHTDHSLAAQVLSAPAPTPVQAQSPTAIVFVDPSVKDYRQFVEQSPPGALVVMLDPREEGVSQIADTLGRHSDVQSVHIISHGAQGELHLGSTVLDADSLGQHAGDLALWSEGLADGADILLYGCDVGAGSAGQGFIDDLAALTGADVAASTDPTGSAALGGDWELESRRGNIGTAALEARGYEGLLAAPTFLYQRQGTGFIETDPLTGGVTGEFLLEQPDGRVIVGGESSYGQIVLVRYLADGSLDGSFGVDGEVLVETGASSNASARSAVLQADGKIVVAGMALNGSHSDVAVLRLTSSGDLDTSFDVDGFLLTDISGGIEEAQGIAVQADGRIVVVGSATAAMSSYSDVFVARYKTDGSLDATFGGTGTGIIVTAVDQYADGAAGVAIDASGNIVVAGFSQMNGSFGLRKDTALLRYTAAGALDTSFGADASGIVRVSAGLFGDTAQAVVIQADGSIVTAGWASDFSGTSAAVLRFDASGALDSTFGTAGVGTYAGIVLTPYSYLGSAGTFELQSVSIDASGRIVAAGSVAFGAARFGVVRYNPDGSPDTGFGTFVLDSLSEGSPTFFQNDPGPITLAQGARLLDADLAALNSGSGDYAGLGVTVSREGGANLDDLLDVSVFGDGTVVVQDGILRDADLLQFGTYQYADGTLTISFDSLEAPASQTLVDATLRLVTYFNTALLPPTSVTMQWTASDGSSSTAGTTDVTIVPINESPTFDGDVTGGGVTIDTVDSGFVGANAITRLADGKYLVAGYEENAAGDQDFALRRYNADGSLDASFGNSGVVLADFAADDDEAFAITVQPDGRILVAGDTFDVDGTYDFAVARFTADGQLDTGFGTGGIASFDFEFDYDTAYGITVMPDGGIVLAGDAYLLSSLDTYAVALIKLDANGALDTAFGTGGRVTTAVGSDDSGFSLAVDAAGRILVAGESFNGADYDFLVARYLADGSLDASFGVGGTVVTDILDSDSSANAITLQADGGIVVAGRVENTVGDYDIAVVRYLADGTLDAGFGSAGVVTVDINSANDSALGVAMSGDRIVVTGYGTTFDATNPDFPTTQQDLVVLRLSADGSLDAGFGAAGVVRLSLSEVGVLTGGDTVGAGVIVEPDGSVVVAGTRSYFGDEALLVRLLPDGSLDPAFGSRFGPTVYGTVSYAPFGAPVVLDPSVSLRDREAVLKAPDGDYTGISVLVTRNPFAGPPDVNDVFGFASAGASFDAADGVLLVGGVEFGTYVSADGMITVNFSSSLATQALVDDVLSRITFANDTLAEGTGVSFFWSCGETGVSGPGNFAVSAVLVTASAANAAPSFDVADGTGIVLTPGPGSAVVAQGNAVIVQPDGRILVAGWAQDPYTGTGQSPLIVTRYLADGSLDTTFGSGGSVTLEGSGSGEDQALSIQLAPDGRIVVAGYLTNAGFDQDYVVIRLNTDGSFDTGFGGDGVVSVDVSGSGFQDLGRAVTIDASGRILVAGQGFDSIDDYVAVLRLGADGTLDPGFGSAGIALINVGSGQELVSSIVVQDTGRIVVAGTQEARIVSGDFMLVALTDTGALDTTFGSAGTGIVLEDLAGGDDRALGMALDADGSILVAGYGTDLVGVGTGEDAAVLKFTPDGLLDTSWPQMFGEFDGRAFLPASVWNDRATGIAINPTDGSILLSGVADVAGYTRALVMLLREGGRPSSTFGVFNEDLFPDPLAFSGGGAVLTSTGSYDAGYGVAVQSDGKVLVTGTSAVGGGAYDQLLIRYNTDGTLDTSFSVGTPVNTLDGTPTFTAGGTAVVLDANVQVIDPEMAALNGGAGNYAGASLVIVREGGTSAEDVFGFDSGAPFGVLGSNLLSFGRVFATFSSSDGTLTITFTGSGTTATQALVDAVMQHITYANQATTPPASAALVWQFSDGTNTVVGGTTVTIQSTANQPPIASNDSAAVIEDATTANLLPGLLANDSDADGDALSVTAVTQGSKGSVQLDNRGTTDASDDILTYTADGAVLDVLAAGQTTTDTFTYTVTDPAGLTSTATVTVTITGTNDAPTSPGASFELVEGQSTSQYAVVFAEGITWSAARDAALALGGGWDLATVTSAAEDNLLISLLRTDLPSRSHFYLGAYIDGVTGAFTWVTGEPFVYTNWGVGQPSGGEDKLAYDFFNGSWGWNDAPDDLSFYGYSRGYVIERAGAGGTLTATDADAGDTLTFALVGTAPTGFTLDASGNWSVDAESYNSLAASQTQTLTVPYTVTDASGASSTASLVITITGTNDAPVATGATVAVLEDGVVSGALPATDPDTGDTLTFSSNVTALPGFTLDAAGNWSFDASGYDSLAAGETQTLTIPYTVTDASGLSSSASLVITITGTNDAPVSPGATASVLEDATVSGTLSATDADEGDTLSFALLGTAPAGVTLDAAGNWSFDASSYDSLSAGQTLTLTVAYTVEDVQDFVVASNPTPYTAKDPGGLSSTTASLVITITGTNDAALLGADSGSTVWGTPVAIDVLANDSDIDNALAVTAITQGTNGSVKILADGRVEYTPTPGFTGTDAFTYTVADGVTQSVTVTVARGDLVWTNASGDNNWSNPDNWNQGLTPTSIDTVVVPDAVGAPQLSGGTTLVALHLSDTLTISDGTLTLTGASTIESTGNLVLDGSTLDGSAVLQSSGTLTLRGGTVNLTLDNAGLLIAEGGGVVDQGTADFVNSGTIIVPPGQNLQIVAGQFINRGDVKGHGTIDVTASLFLNDGAVSPGSSPGILTVSGNYTQTGAGVLNIELAGPVAGTQYDQLIVSGTATLAGNLNLILLNGFVPGPNDGIQILSAGSIVGDFGSISGLPPGVTFSVTGGFGQSVPPVIPGTTVLSTTPVAVVYIGVVSLDPAIYGGAPEQTWIYQALAPPPEDYMVGDLEWQDMMEDIMAMIAGEDIALTDTGEITLTDATKGGAQPDASLEAQLRAIADQFTDEQQQILDQLRAAEELLTCP